MCGGGGTTTTNTTSNQPPQAFLDAYSNVLGQAQQVASQPLQQYTGNVVAGFTPAQNQAFDTINNLQGVSDPYLNAASGFLNQATTPIWDNAQQLTPQDIQQYQNPYQQQVVNATQAQFNNQNAQQQNQLKGNAVSAGAWGGDRAGVAQGVLAGQQQLAQAPVIAGLESQGYSQALQTAQQQQGAQIGANEANAWLNSQAGFGAMNLAGEAQNLPLQQAQAQLGAGSLQQQLGQEELNVPYEQFLQQQAYPFQTTQYLANIAEGTGSQAGGTGTGSTTSPGADQTGQILGTVGSIAGLAALAFLERGGRVGRAKGGLIPTNPEPAGDVQAQIAAAADPRNGKDSVFISAGNEDAVPTHLPPGIQIHRRPEGTLLTTNPAKHELFRSKNQLTDDDMASILGYPESKSGLIDHAARGGMISGIQARDHLGNVVSDAATSHPHETAAALSSHVPPGGYLTNMPLEAVHKRRMLHRPNGGLLPYTPPPGQSQERAMLPTHAMLPSGTTMQHPMQHLSTAPVQNFSSNPVGLPSVTIPNSAHSAPAATPPAAVTPQRSQNMYSGEYYMDGGKQFVYAEPGTSANGGRLATGGMVQNPMTGALVRRAGGGMLPDVPDVSVSYIPDSRPSIMGHGPPVAEAPKPPAQQGGGGGSPDMSGFKTAAKAFNNRDPYGLNSNSSYINNPMNYGDNYGGLSNDIFAGMGGEAAAGAGVGEDLSLFGGLKRGGVIPHYDDGGDIEDDDAPLVGADDDTVMPVQANTPVAGPPQSAGRGFSGPSPAKIEPEEANPWLSLLAGSAALLGGTSPNLGVNLGRGLSAGVQNYIGQKKELATEAQQRAQVEGQNQSRGLQYQRDVNTNDFRTQQLKQQGDYQNKHLDIMSQDAATRAEQAKQRAKQIADQTDLERKKVDQAAIPPDVRTAKWLSTATPEEKKAYRDYQAIKSGAPPSAADGQSGASGEIPHGDDFLKTLSPEVQPIVKAMVEGRQSPPSSFAMSKPYWQTMIQYANQYDPAFDQTTWPQRTATATDFSSKGKSGQAVTAINTAMGHLSNLSDDFSRLGNYSGVGTVLNAPGNWLAEKSGSEAPTNARLDATAVASELRKVFAATGGGNLTELEQWEHNLPINGSPEQQKGAIEHAIGLMDSRLNALADAHNRGFGKTDEPQSLLSPESRSAYEKLTGRQANSSMIGPRPSVNQPQLGARGNTPPAAATVLSRPNGVPEGSVYSPSRNMWRDPSGKTYPGQ